MSPDPFRLLKNLFVDFLLWVSGTWVGAPDDAPWEESASRDDSPPDAPQAPSAAGDATG